MLAKRLEGKTVLVAGPGGNLGPIWVSNLLNQGARVWGIGKGVAGDSLLSDLKKVWDDKLFLSELDLTTEPAQNPISDWWPGETNDLVVDAVIVNAGIDALPGEGKRLLEDYTRDEWSKVFTVNVFGVVDLLNSLEKHLANPSSVVVLGSLYGIVSPNPALYSHFNDGSGSVKHPAYGSSKAALVALARQYATHWAPRGVRVNVLTLGGVAAGQDDQFVQKYSAVSPSAGMLSKSDIIGPMLFLISDDSLGMTGHNLVVDGGFTAW